MTKELVSLQTIQEKLKERIKASFADLIPEEAWNELIKREWEVFANGSPERKNSWGHVEQAAQPSALSAMIRAGIGAVIKSKVDTWIARIEKADETDVEVKAMIERVAEVGAKNMKAVLGEMIFQSVNQAITMSYRGCQCGFRMIGGQNCPKCGAYVQA